MLLEKVSFRRFLCHATATMAFLLAACGGDNGSSSPTEGNGPQPVSVETETSSGLYSQPADEKGSSSISSSSNKVLLISSSSMDSVPSSSSFELPSVKVDSILDSRNGMNYRTVKIGSQTWMAENLNYATETSLCYDHDVVNCAKFGRLYEWPDVDTVCPAGWKLPSKEDFDILLEAVGGAEIAGKMLRSSSGWYREDGLDAVSFTVLPAGDCDDYNGFMDIYDGTSFWTSSDDEFGKVLILGISDYSDVAVWQNGTRSGTWFPIRCLKK
ncbi:hypothetical protein B7994_03975 [Fibrobacter sp. UWR2]|nr:hypothetical protein B7994_03975 [Fibrobacter sp. UWR2]